jgi:hypothetical protein
LKERTIDDITGKSYFTHKRLRSAYLSIKNNLPYLFVFEKVNGMPNTNSALEGSFTALKIVCAIIMECQKKTASGLLMSFLRHKQYAKKSKKRPL